MSIITTVIWAIIIILILVGLGLLVYYLIKRFEPSGPSGASGPPGPSGDTGPPPTEVYISNVIAQVNQTCPSGYINPGVFGSSNGNLKQATGGSTPNIYLCMSQTNDPNSAITDLRVFQFGGLTELECPQGNRLTYDDNGSTEWDFQKGCGLTSPNTKLCQVGQGGQFGSIRDIVVTAAPSGTPGCPTGYFPYNIDDHYIGQGIPGDLNRNCGGNTVMLCLKR